MWNFTNKKPTDKGMSIGGTNIVDSIGNYIIAYGSFGFHQNVQDLIPLVPGHLDGIQYHTIGKERVA